MYALTTEIRKKRKKKTGRPIHWLSRFLFMWSDRESNPDLIFRRDLFYPLNYQTIV